MRYPIFAAALFCLVTPIAHAQTYSQEQETTSQMLDQEDAYREGVDNGRAALRREQEQYNNSYPSGCH